MKLLLPSVVIFLFEKKKEQSLWVPEREQTHVVNIRREPAVVVVLLLIVDLPF